jgi:probable O-glycosylation ligase (exosortase A-associated)
MVPALFFFMPARWHERMDSIAQYQQDASAMNRIEAWTMAYNAANDRVFGGGFGMWSPEMYAAYGPKITGKSPGTRGAHSIYFSVLGEHGWVGLGLFLAVFFAAWRAANQIIRQTREVEDLVWLADLARMVQESIVAYATGGAFQSLAYFDYPWHLVSIVVVGCDIVQRYHREAQAERQIDLHSTRSRAGLLAIHARRAAP